MGDSVLISPTILAASVKPEERRFIFVANANSDVVYASRIDSVLRLFARSLNCSKSETGRPQPNVASDVDGLEIAESSYRKRIGKLNSKNFVVLTFWCTEYLTFKLRNST